MAIRNLVTIPNFAAKKNSVSKGITTVGVPAGSIAVAIFAGTTVLYCSMTAEINSLYSDAKSSYIQCIDVKQETGLCDLENRAIDLWKVKNLDKIEKMSHFEANWNGTGGAAFTAAAISFFRSMIETLEKQPDIAPTGRNSLLMQYELEDKSILAFEVGVDRVEKVIVPKGDYSMAQMEIFTENVTEKIKESVRQFYGFKEHR